MDGIHSLGGTREPRETIGTARETAAAAPIVNALSIDVEDYFQVSAFENHVPRSEWDMLPCRVERNVERILELLNGGRAQATFFVLGWVAER